MWYAKMYFFKDREIFQYDPLGTRGVPSIQKELPFLESLLSFQELDFSNVIPLIRNIADNWGSFIAENDKDALTAAMKTLGILKSIHVYFELLYVRCYYRQTAAYIRNDRGNAEDQQLLDELRRLPELLPLYQKQIQRFFDLVLDVDTAGRHPQTQAAKNYTYYGPADSELFCFHPISLSFERMEPERCSSVLYSSSIQDMIDYSLRSCVERNITVRRCKNCGRYFAQTGRVSTEYCSRPPVQTGQQPCRETGAWKQWTIRQESDEAFSSYRREYKKRFAWIKAGRISDEDFYAWSEQAREQKKKCNKGLITLEEFQRWLSES